jgi:hypothetical protein
MNRHRRRPLKLQLRAAPKQKVVYRSSRKLSLRVVLAGVLLALIMAGALGFAAVALLKNARMKREGHAPVASPSATALVAGTVNPVPTTIGAPPSPVVSATPALSPSVTPILRPTAVVKERVPQAEKAPVEVDRKSAEQRRREAERKRTHLEALYKNHQISDQAYKRGQEEYQAEMTKYRNVVGGAGSPSRSQ